MERWTAWSFGCVAGKVFGWMDGWMDAFAIFGRGVVIVFYVDIDIDIDIHILSSFAEYSTCDVDGCVFNLVYL